MNTFNTFEKTPATFDAVETGFFKKFFGFFVGFFKKFFGFFFKRFKE